MKFSKKKNCGKLDYQQKGDKTFAFIIVEYLKLGLRKNYN